MLIKQKKMIKIHNSIQNSNLRKALKKINKTLADKTRNWRKWGTRAGYNSMIDIELKRDVFIWNLKNGRLE